MALLDLLGRGLVTPFRRGSNDFAAGEDLELVQSMVGQVLGTRGSSDFTDGELPWRGDFGSLLHILRHRNNNQATQELARIYVVEALAKWVPQVRIKAVEIEKKKGPDGEDSVIFVHLVYDLIGIKRPGNEVLIRDVTQTVSLT